MESSRTVAPELCLKVALAVIILARIPMLFLPVGGPDEALWLSCGQKIALGAPPYVAGTDHKGPLLFYFYAVPRLLFDDSTLFGPRALGTLWVVLVCLTVHTLGRRLAGGRAAGWAALAYAFHSSCLGPGECLVPMSEHLMNLPLALAVLAFVTGRSQRGPAAYVAAGALLWAAGMFRQVALLMVPGLMLCAVLDECLRRVRHETPTTRQALLRALRTVAALASGSLLAAAGTWVWMDELGVSSEFIYWVFLAPFDFVTRMGSRPFDLLQAVALLRGVFRIWDLLLGAAVFAAWTAWRLRQGLSRGFAGARPGLEDSLLLLGWTAVTILAVFPGRTFFAHYFLQPMVPASLLLAIVLENAWEGRARWLERLRRDWTWRFAALGVIAFLAFFFSRCLFWSQLGPLYQRLFGFLRHDLVAENSTERVAFRLLPCVRRDEPLFLWGYRPEICAMTGTVLASSFSDTAFVARVYSRPDGTSPLADTLSGRRDFYKLMIDGVEARKPAWIIDSHRTPPGAPDLPLDHYDYFRRLLAAEFEPPELIDGILLYRRRHPR